MKRTTPRPTGPAALLRRWWPDSNPLRRTADKVEAVVIMVLLVLFLAGAPLAALAVGHGVSASSTRAERAQAGWHQVPAVLLRTAPVQGQARGQAAMESRVPVRWTAPGGVSRTGQAYAPSGTAAGSSVPVWTDGSGRQTGVPVRSTDAATLAVLVASLAVVAVAILACLAWLFAHRVLDRRRLAGWDAGWSDTGPQWSGRR